MADMSDDDDLRDSRTAAMAAIDQQMAAALGDREVVEAWLGLHEAIETMDKALADRGTVAVNRTSSIVGFTASTVLALAHKRGDTGKPAF